MNKFRPEMTPAEQRDFLTHTRLFLSKDVKRVLYGRDLYVVKHVPTGLKLRLNSDQLFVLGQFGRGTTVAEMVPQLIMNRRCLPLSELYELVLMARAANILNEHRDEEFAPDYPPRWWPSIDADAAQMLWWLSCFAGIFVACFWAISEDASKLPAPDWWQLLIAWPVLSLCASLGGLFASAYVHRVGCDTRRPSLIWKSLIPRVGFDWSDIDMAGPDGHRVVAKLRIFPFILLAFCCTAIPELRVWAPVSIIALLWRVAPLPGSAVVQWVQSRVRRMMLGTERPVYFYRYSQTISSRVWREFRATDWTFISWLILWTVIWFATACWFVGAFREGRALAVFPYFFGSGAVEALRMAGFVSCGMAMVFAVVLLAGWVRQKKEEAQVVHAPDDTAGSGLTHAQIIEDCALLRELPVEIRAQLTEMGRLVTVSAGQPVVGVGEKGEDFYIIASGELDLSLMRPKGKPDKVAVLLRGDVFGEYSFFGSLFRTRNLRARTEVTLLALASPELETILKRHLSVPAIEEIIQRRTFLRRIALSSAWAPISVSRFAKAARFEDVREGQTVIGTGRENRFFYLVYEGGLDVKQRGRSRARIAPGDFFGEISLLLNNLATADIVAEVPSRCLVLQKSDFLALMSHDIELALQLEHVASVRMGRPVFPFQGSSIESIAN